MLKFCKNNNHNEKYDERDASFIRSSLVCPRYKTKCTAISTALTLSEELSICSRVSRYCQSKLKCFFLCLFTCRRQCRNSQPLNDFWTDFVSRALTFIRYQLNTYLSFDWSFFQLLPTAKTRKNDYLFLLYPGTDFKTFRCVDLILLLF